MAWLQSVVWQNTRHVHVWFQLDPRNAITKEWRSNSVIEIPDEDAKSMTVDQLTARYLDAGKKVEDRPLRMRKTEFIAVLVGIIETSTQDGEVSNAKDCYKQATGRDYVKGGIK